MLFNCLYGQAYDAAEVGETLGQRIDNMRFAYLPTRMEGPTPRYTYLLDTGISADRHGMLIIENERILDLINN